MADRESSSENNTRSRSVQDFVRTVLHAITNLQTQSGNPNRAENSSSAEFSSTEEEINARFQIPRHRQGIPNRSATSTRVVASTAYVRDRTTAQYKGTSAGAQREEEEITIPQMQEAKTQPNTFTKISVNYLTLNGIQVPRGATKGNVVPRGLYIDAFRLDKN